MVPTRGWTSKHLRWPEDAVERDYNDKPPRDNPEAANKLCGGLLSLNACHSYPRSWQPVVPVEFSSPGARKRIDFYMWNGFAPLRKLRRSRMGRDRVLSEGLGLEARCSGPPAGCRLAAPLGMPSGD